MPAQAWASILDSSPLAMASWVSVQPLTLVLKRGMPTPVCRPTGCTLGVQLLYFIALEELQKKEAMEKLNKVRADFKVFIILNYAIPCME